MIRPPQGTQGPRLRSLLPTLLLCSATSLAEPGTVTPFGRFSLFAHSAPVSIDSALNDWQGRYRNGEEQFAYLWMEAGIRQDDWSLSVLLRNDYGIRFSNDTADYYHRTQNDIGTQDRRYDLDLGATHFTLSGLRMARYFHRPASGRQWRIGISLFTTTELIDGTLGGTDQQARLDYRYSEDTLFHRDVAKPTGWGASLDLAVDWRLDERTTLHGEATDLFGGIVWQNVPRTVADANADRSHLDENGNTMLDPLVSGIETTERRWTQRLPMRLHLIIDHAWHPRLSARLQLRHLNGNHHWAPGLRWRWHDLQTELSYWPDLDLATLQLKKNRWQLSVGLDTPDRQAAHTLYFGFSYNHW